jgi:hypothetical protein
MSKINVWSEDEVNKIFDALGLNDNDKKEQPKPLPLEKNNFVNKRICLPRLSSNSVPPPTGVITNANMEDLTK